VNHLTSCFLLLLLQLQLLFNSVGGSQGKAGERVAGHQRLELLGYLRMQGGESRQKL
jgi:hypothetical protein